MTETVVRHNPRFGRWSLIVNHVRLRGGCSMGQIDLELGCSPGRQYELFREFRDYAKDVILKGGRWTVKPLESTPETAETST